MTLLPTIALDLSGNDYLLPYMQRQFPMPENPDEEPLPAVAGVKIATADTEGRRDEQFEAFCAERGLPIATIFCPHIVCTGMQGLPRRIAAGVHSGRYMHIEGSEARISVVHGTDVALAASIALGSQGAYILTDGTDPTIHDLAEALAYRMDNKRIFTIKPRWARWWYGKTYFETLTTDHVSPDSFAASFPEMHPTPVTTYLRTHVYDAHSL